MSRALALQGVAGRTEIFPTTGLVASALHPILRGDKGGTGSTEVLSYLNVTGIQEHLGSWNRG
jgi:hypothetical protein